MANALYYGDNLEVLRESIKDESVDLKCVVRHVRVVLQRRPRASGRIAMDGIKAGLRVSLSAIGLALSFTASAAFPDINQQGLTGSWFEPSEAGQGIELEIYPNFIANGVGFVDGAWFTFDVAPVGGADHQRWYTFAGNAVTGNNGIAQVTIYQNVGGNFNAPPVTNAVAVGSGVLSFSDCNNGGLLYNFTDGSNRSGLLVLSRIAPNVTCVVSGTPTTNADFGLSGNWFDPTTSGQGFVFEVNPLAPVVFFAWYTYSPTGQMAGAAGQRWFTGQGTFTAGTHTAPLTLFETTGGVFDTPLPMSCTQVEVEPCPQMTNVVGTATITFTSCASAQLTYNFTGGSSAGHAGVIDLGRVGPVPAGCAI